jgi:hypothetical protein
MSSSRARVSSRGWLTIHKPDSEQSLDRGYDIAALVAEVAVLTRRIEALERGRGARDGADEALVRQLGASTRGLIFSVRSLWAHRAVDMELAQALLDCDIDNTKQLGKALRRFANHRVSGWTIRRLGRSHDGAIWQVQCDSELSEIA